MIADMTNEQVFDSIIYQILEDFETKEITIHDALSEIKDEVKNQ